ncbi:MAG: hypothetical protein QXO45_06635 [Nitrososphaerota archaeon]
MNVKEFLKESLMLALLMTTPPIALLVLIKITEPRISWLSLFLWTVLAVSWTIFVALTYYKKSLKTIRK